jgi:putative salt-induced outer membrane protein YdiY
MQMRTFALAAFLSLATFADQVVMKNGDRVTGTIVKKDAKSLTISTTHFGTVTLPWEQVENIKAETPITVVTSDGKATQATIATAGDKIQVTPKGEGARTVAPTEIVAMRDAAEQRAYERLLAPGLGDLWAGSATLGLAGTSGNAETTTLSVGMGAARATNTDTTKVYFNAIRASALINNLSSTTAQAVRGGWSYNRNLKPRLFFNTFNDWEYDRFQSLDLRTVLGAGLGYMAWKGERGRLDLLGGLAWNREKFSPTPRPSFTRNGADAYWGNDFTYRLNTRTSLFQSFRMFNNLNQSDRWRMNFDAGATTQLTKWLTWNVSVSDRFLNLPVAGRKKNDFLYTTGFGVSFAR